VLLKREMRQREERTMVEFELAYESQAGAAQLLTKLGALGELRDAVLQHCRETSPSPPYKPERIKQLMKPAGWVPEVRVPPLSSAYDALPINDRYDLWKVFETNRREVGVGIEIEKWEVWHDLLKFRRGYDRGQIVAGIILHDNPANLHYVYDHLRLVALRLFADIPILFAAPKGGDLLSAKESAGPKYQPYLMPGDEFQVSSAVKPRA
jgi:hypothetical protein